MADEKVRNKIISNNKALNIYRESKYIDISDYKNKYKKENNIEEIEENESSFLDIAKNIGKVLGAIIFSPILLIAYPIYLATHKNDKDKTKQEEEQFKPVDNISYIDKNGDIVNWKIKRKNKKKIINLPIKKHKIINKTYNKTLDNLHRKKIIKPYSKISLIESKKIKNIKK